MAARSASRGDDDGVGGYDADTSIESLCCRIHVPLPARLTDAVVDG